MSNRAFKVTDPPPVEPDFIEMDLEGKGRSVTFDIKFRSEPNTETSGFMEIQLFRRGAEEGKKPFWKFRHKWTVRIYVDVVPLDPLDPRRSFLVLNCAYGSLVGDLRVFRWDGTTLREVPGPDISFAWPAKFPDGSRLLLQETGDYGDGAECLYGYRGGVLIPVNYDRPEFYQEGIGKILEEFRAMRSQDRPGPTQLQFQIRGLDRFLYGGRAKEGLKFYGELEKWCRRWDEKSLDWLRGQTHRFRALALMNMGRYQEGVEEFGRYGPGDGPKTTREIQEFIGEYHLMRGEFKQALAAYRKASKALNVRTDLRYNPQYDRQIEYLKAAAEKFKR